MSRYDHPSYLEHIGIPVVSEDMYECEACGKNLRPMGQYRSGFTTWLWWQCEGCGKILYAKSTFGMPTPLLEWDELPYETVR